MTATEPKGIYYEVNLKLKRLVRTSSSEQYALFDLDQVDVDQQPITIGKLDVHYTGEGLYGTLFLWDDMSRELNLGRRADFVRSLLNEIAQPMGGRVNMLSRFFAPTLDAYEVFHNVGETDISEVDYNEHVSD